MHGRLHEVVRTKHVISSLTLLLCTLPPLLCRGCGLRLRLLLSGATAPAGQIHRVLTLVSPDGSGQEGLRGPVGVEPRAELHRAGGADRARGAAAGAAPADGQARGVLVVYAANVITLRKQHPHWSNALVDLEGAQWLGQLQVDFFATVEFHGGSGDGGQGADADAAAFVHHDLQCTRRHHITHILAAAEAQGLAVYLGTREFNRFVLGAMGDLYLTRIAPINEVLPLLRVVPQFLQLSLGLGSGRAGGALLEAQRLIACRLLALVLLLGFPHQGLRLRVPGRVVCHRCLSGRNICDNRKRVRWQTACNL
mmetsp:Transcript_7190/g.19968  ORF Transcript_7190/g.19968 Transcript_7190/m.19968 type:complete len:310 (+) Transcript_7190:394-1323(+)